MGRRGPPPKPTATRRREGNPRNRPLPKDEPEPKAVEKLPEAPDHLNELGKKTFRHLAKVLKDCDLLTVADLYPLEMFCDQYSQWVAALKLRSEKGCIIEITNDEGVLVNTYETPESKLCRALAADCNRWFKVLGLGPAYRVGLRTNSDGSDSIEDPVAASIAGD